MNARFLATSVDGGRRLLSKAATRTSAAASPGGYSPTPRDFIKSFYAVLERWQRETVALSDVSRKKAHPAFDALVLNARIALPLIMSELERNPSFLVLVLNEAFGHDPSIPKSGGNLRQMTDAWLRWGMHRDSNAG